MSVGIIFPLLHVRGTLVAFYPWLPNARGCLKPMLEGAIGFPEVGKLQNCSLTEIDVLTHCEEETTIAIHNEDLGDCWFRLGSLVNSVDHLPQGLLEANEQSLNTLYGALHLTGDDASAAAEGRSPTTQESSKS